MQRSMTESRDPLEASARARGFEFVLHVYIGTALILLGVLLSGVALQRVMSL